MYSRDLISRDPKIHPVKDDVLIAKLGKNSSLVFEAYAQLGEGKDHAKFQSVCSVGYKYFPEVIVNNEKFANVDEMKYVADKCHVHVMEVLDDQLTLTEDYWKKCDSCNSCIQYAPPDAIQVKAIPDKFIFTVEGTGALPLQSLKKPCRSFWRNWDEFEKKLDKAKITVVPDYMKLRTANE